MANDSSTGGPLLPYSVAAGGTQPLEGQALNRFIQGWVVGLTGLPGTMVRPRWQAEPADIPDAGNAWAAIGINSRAADTFPYIGHDPVGPTGQGADDLQRNETLRILISFYDLGTNGLADYYAELFREGTAIAQNRELLTLAQFNFIDCDEPVAVPALLKERWLYRVDVPFRLRRMISLVYPVLNIESIEVTISSQDPAGNNFDLTVTATDDE
jgi:hypothetical protein